MQQSRLMWLTLNISDSLVHKKTSPSKRKTQVLLLTFTFEIFQNKRRLNLIIRLSLAAVAIRTA